MHKRVVLFAGGSGITPTMSMLRYIEDLGLDTEVTLFYSVRTRHDIIFGTELELLEERLPRLSRIMVLTKADDRWGGEKGRITSDLVLKHLGDLSGRTNFVCGPQLFMQHIKGILLASSVTREQIMEERFDSGKIGAGPGVDAEIFQGTIEFSKSGQTVRSLPGQTLLETAEANGIVLPYGCRQGQCGTCATRLVAGEVDSHGILDPGQGYVLACVSHARGDVQLDACNLSWNILDARRYI